MDIKLPIQFDSITAPTAKFLAWMGVVLILAPKINLISIPGQTAGLRVDDLLLGMTLFFVCFTAISGNLRVSGSGYWLVITSMFISFVISKLLGWPSNILYVIRLIEYSTFIYLGYFYARWHSLSMAASVILISNFAVMLMQFFGIWGGFTSDGYVSEVGRLVGLTAGPWEIGYILNIIFVIFLENRQLSSRHHFILGSLILVLILLTGSRASAATFLLISLITVFSRTTITRAAPYVISMFSAISAFILLFGEQLLQRSENIFNIENINYFLEFYDGLTPIGIFTMDSFEEISHNTDVDASWLIRSTHWALALKEFFANPMFLPFGLGPGTFGPALDGAWTRILVEGGLVGLFFYTFFLRRFNLLVQGGGLISTATAINMTFIDIHISYKSMALLLFVLGHNLRETTNER